ncbi:MAG TPA: 4-(cytidine 5'-diphospho)-2-C-methyl-D-erythritol kinase [Vicinamibacterales bacterium]|jgi:4-diphosphocytidyl-2-C-methyl-D-erythritol kinase|nr:4-(cytidine 5'-diphospho)-2-C-methyl-D-erythritol kinase [Vicinamibacterales bacterium]
MSSRTLVLRPSAKINLTLRVGPRRDDGFHDVTTVLQSIAIADTLTVTARPGPFGLSSRSPGVPVDRSNLVWRAAEVLWRERGRTGDPRDAHVKLDKQIPVAAGLGGGSADAAAALVALNTIWNARRPRRALLALAAEIGSDVPFFLLGGTAIGLGRGDELYPVDDVAKLGVIVIKPSFGVATADAYRWLDEARASAAATPAMRGADIDVGWPTGPVALANDLQAPVAERHPMITEMIDACLKEGALGAAMSGSGSAVFGLFPDAVARRAIRRLQRPDWLVLLTRTLTRHEAGRRIGL